jgi:diguanylate cyclase (GGDEF)-like protein
VSAADGRMTAVTVERCCVVDDALARRLSRCPALPTLPGVAVEVLRACTPDGEEVDLDQLAAIIEQDPALVTKVLRVVNSAVYAVRQPVTSLRHALVLLGVIAVRAIALSFSLTSTVRKEPRGADLQRYWQRSLYAAIGAQELARILRPALKEEAFLAGLIQDIGMVALARLEPTTYAEIMTTAGADHEEVAAAERRTFGADHVEVGDWLLGQWGIAPLLRETVAASHAVVVAEDVSPLSGIVAGSGPIADIWVERRADGATRARDRARALLGIDDDALEGVLSRVAREVVDTAAVFEVDLGSPEDVAAVLEQAKDALVTASLVVARTAHTLEEEAWRDPLTGLPNRARLDALLGAKFRQSDAVFSVLICDIDHFKAVNDTYGHLAGDRALVSVAGRLRHCLRSADLVVRFGGEEFVVVLPGAPLEAASTVAERLRAAVGDRPHDVGGGHVVPITISIGCSTQGVPDRFPSPAALLESADRALYAAKAEGRDRVVTAAARDTRRRP